MNFNFGTIGEPPRWFYLYLLWIFPEPVPACSSPSAADECRFLESRHPPLRGTGRQRSSGIAQTDYALVQIRCHFKTLRYKRFSNEKPSATPCLSPLSLRSLVFTSFILRSLRVSPFFLGGGLDFLLSRPFSACLFVWEQVKDSVWSQHVEKKASYVAKKGLKSRKALEFLRYYNHLGFFPFYPVSNYRESVCKPHRNSSSV